MDNQKIIEILKEFGIETERELDAALKKSTFSLGSMADGALASMASSPLTMKSKADR